MVPSLNPVMALLPEFTVRTRLLTGSTAMAPGIVTLVGVVEAQFAAQTVARPFWPVVTIAGRCKREGSSSDTSLALGLEETAVLEKGWNATVSAPNSGEPVVTWPVASENTVMGVGISFWGLRKIICLEVALGSARTACLVPGFLARPTIEDAVVKLRQGLPYS